MLIQVNAAKCIGTQAVKVIVETKIDHGIGIHLVGLVDVAVKESLLRTTTALTSIGFRIPGKKIIINLAPADMRKNGSGYDLPIAVGILAASEKYVFETVSDYFIMGELSLDAALRPIDGAIPYAELAARLGLKGIILPRESAREAAEIVEMPVYGVDCLPEVIKILEGKENCEDLLMRPTGLRAVLPGKNSGLDLSEIIGQEEAKRALEIAAAGGHNLVMIGSPGSGKSSLAKALSGILPPLTRSESVETSRIYSAAGLLKGHGGLVTERPFRTPHHSSSMSAVIGGGNGSAIIPGEITLAHNGVLFLDEITQMPRSILEALRAPLEDRSVTISRMSGKLTFPASFMLVAASNPCPCGYFGEGSRCRCTALQRETYIKRLSGPVMDRIDLQVWVHGISPERLRSSAKGECSAAVAVRVKKARLLQERRFRDEDISVNAEMRNRHIEKFCPLDEESRNSLEKLVANSGMSLRAWFRIIKVARTIADLEDSERITAAHLMEAAGFRLLDKSGGET